MMAWRRRKFSFEGGAAKYDGSRARLRGRPSPLARRPGRATADDGAQKSVVGVAASRRTDEPRPGLGRSTIARILKDNGIEPAPIRRTTLLWKTSLKAHWDAIAAADLIARNLIDSITGPLNGVVYLIVDRDPLYTEHFKTLLSSAGREHWTAPRLPVARRTFKPAIGHESVRKSLPMAFRTRAGRKSQKAMAFSRRLVDHPVGGCASRQRRGASQQSGG
jgi:hypothetical protein